MALYQFRNGIPLTTAAAANFTRGELATALRKVSSLAFGCGYSFRIFGLCDGNINLILCCLIACTRV